MKTAMAFVIWLVGAAAAALDQAQPGALRPSASAIGALQCEQDRAKAVANGWDMADVHLPCEPGVVLPIRANEVKPRYTVKAMQAKIQGPVEVAAIVDADGVAREVKIATSLDATLGLDEEAVKAVRATNFKPGTLDGKPTRVLVKFHLQFTLR